MLHVAEVLTEVTAHTACRRVGIVHFRMARLKVLKLPHQHVKLHVAHNRAVIYIIVAVISVQQIPQLQYSFFIVHSCQKKQKSGAYKKFFP